MESTRKLTAQIEPFDSFWEGPENVEKGYRTFGKFYKDNYMRYVPKDRQSKILVISCGPGYFVSMLLKEGYSDVLGIDSYPEKVKFSQNHHLNCRVEEGFGFLEKTKDEFDLIFCEQELNHLTKEEILVFIELCRKSLKANGTLIAHALNGANPITGAEALAQNFDHYNTFTEYTFRQVLEFSGFQEIKIIPLNLYVFYTNPMNYVGMVMAGLFTLFFRFSFMLYGKSNRIFTKKIAGISRKIG